MWTSLPVRCYSNDLYSSDSLLTIPSYYSIPFTKDLLKTIYIVCIYSIYIITIDNFLFFLMILFLFCKLNFIFVTLGSGYVARK